MIKSGQLNIIVGTHSLLGSRVVYNNLGLLVVDEEQVWFLSSGFYFRWVLFWVVIFINFFSFDKKEVIILIVLKQEAKIWNQ